MERNTIIIIALLAVILALLAGIGFMTADIGKQDTVLTFKSNDAVDEGGSIKIMLSDVNGTAIANQTVNVTITDKDNSKSYYSVGTGEKGNGTLKLDKDAGEYDVMVIYGGNDDYNGCNATQKLTIKEKTTEAASNSCIPYAYKSDGTPMYSQQEVNDYMAAKYGLCDYDIQANGYIDLKHGGERGKYSTNWKDGTEESGLR